MFKLARFAAVLVSAALVSAGAVSGAMAATVTSATGPDGKAVISVVGNIAPGDATALLWLITSSHEAGQPVAAVRLDSPGGNLIEGVALAKQLRAAQATTVIGDGVTCASACFVAFTGGTTRSASYSARVGVHGVAESSGEESVIAYAATVTLARLIKDFGVPEAIIGKLVVTPPSQMVWLSPEDLRSMGTVMTGRSARTAARNPGNVQRDTAAVGALARQPELSKVLSWEDFVNSVVDVSSHQNNGKPRVDRVCLPDSQTCQMSVYAVGRDTKDMMAQTTEDLDGNVIRKDICELNRHKDIRTCRDWDSGQYTRLVKDHEGQWIEVESPS